MRIRNTLVNSAYAIVSYCILAVLALLVRKTFVNSLSSDLLGYEGLFSNIFSLLALADLGVESIILYRLFPAFANNDTREINALMSLYRKLYSFVGGTILVVGILLLPALKFIISGNNLNWGYVYTIYSVQLVVTLCTYFLAYKRLMFAVSQQEYECTKVDTSVTIFFNLIKILVLIIFKSYMLYLFCNLMTNLLSNIIISIKVKKKFLYFKIDKTIKLSAVKEIGVAKEIKNNIVQKVCGTIYGGTDNIVVSTFLGIEKVGLLSNYSLMQSYVTSFMTKMLKPFQMSIGNYIYSTSKKEGHMMFRMFDMISFFIACVVSTCYMCVFEVFIILWIGNEYTLGSEFVLAFSINQYVQWNHQFLTFYRYSFGRYELDRMPIFLAAVCNIVLSIVLSKYCGIAGIMLGTAISHLGLWIGRVRVVYTEYIDEKISVYVRRQIIRFFLWVGETTIVYYICSNWTISWLGLFYRIIFCVLFSVFINTLVFFRTEEMKSVFYYLRKVINVLKK